MNAYKTMLVLLLLIIALAFMFSIPKVNYGALSQDVANGNPYILYHGLFSASLLVFLFLTVLLLFLCRRSWLRYVILLVSYMWPMIMVVSFLLPMEGMLGFVVGDQPRLEFALGSLLVSGKVTFEEASKVSGYFNWPSAWIFEGVFSNILGLNPFESPVFLMMGVYFLLGLAVIITSKRFLYGIPSNIVMVSMLAYTILNPYKILHLCPQIYALTLFVLYTYMLIKEQLKAVDLLTLFVLSATIITAHPLTSIVIVGIVLPISLFYVIRKAKELSQVAIFAVSVMILFIMWNLRFEILVRSVLTELFEGLAPQSLQSLQPLPPVAGVSIYQADSFFKFMAAYRYICLSLLMVSGLASMILILRGGEGMLKLKVLGVILGMLAGSIGLNFVPGTFFHRILYFTSTIIIVTLPMSATYILRILKRGLVSQKIFTYLVVLVIASTPFLSHLAFLEFLTDSNPVGAITSPYEEIAYIFLAKHYDFDNVIAVPSGTLGFYVGMLNFNATNYLRLQSTSDSISYISILPTDYNSSAMFVNMVYAGKIFVVSPREKYILYQHTLFHDFHSVELYINNNYLRAYDNSVFRVYACT